MNRSTLRMAIIVLTLATAIIHGVFLNIGMGTIDPVFTLNALGFLGLLAALFFVPLPFLRGREALLHYALMGFAVITIVAYFIVNGGVAFRNPLGLATKAIEVLLIIAVWLHLRATQKPG